MGTLGLKLAASYGGGNLRQLNQVLWLLHCAGSSARIQLVEPSAAVPKLNLLDANGHVFELPLPETAFSSEKARNGLIQVALSRMASGPNVETTLRKMLPKVGQTQMQAATEWWQTELGLCVGEVGRYLDTAEMPEVVWISTRLQRSVAELGIDLADALRGEQHLETRIAQTGASQIPQISHDMGAEFKIALAKLREQIGLEAPTLFGHYSRLKRAGNRAIKDFQKSTERHFRNHKGIKENRLRHLAQALRPDDHAQQDRISLIYAMALFHLHPQRFVKHNELFHGAGAQDVVIVNTETGIRSLISLSC
jgi:hypothetical protein